MKLLIVANLHHEVSVKLIKFIKLKKIKFDLIDTSKIKRILKFCLNQTNQKIIIG